MTGGFVCSGWRSQTGSATRLAAATWSARGTSSRCGQSLSVSRRCSVQMKASSSSSPDPQPPSPSSEILEGPFKGHYGSWYLTRDDVNGVLAYRSALLAMALTTGLGVGLAVTQSHPSPRVLDALYLLASGSFGVALWTIHIYMKPMHNFLKALWGVGTAGAIATLIFGQQGIVFSSYDNTLWLLGLGWSFVALTGLFFKEAVCFNRQEAWGLTVLLPILSGGHFLHALPETFERSGLVAFAAGFLFFALRKFQQPSTDDLGDKSVFDFLHKQRLETGTSKNYENSA